MKSIQGFIIDYLVEDELMDINSNLVCESFNCQLLKDLAKQLKNQKDTEKKKNDEEYQTKLKEYKEKGWGEPYRDTHVYSQDFKKIFGGYYGNVEWYKITDDDITKIPASEDINKKTDKFVRDVIKGNKQAIILIKDKEDKEFVYVIFTNGYMFRLNNGGYREHPGSQLGYRTGSRRTQWHDLPQKDKIELCQNKNLYIIDTSKVKMEWLNKHDERYKQKQGMIMMDPDSLREIAKKNVDRYKEIIRKNAASKKNNNALLDECEKIIKRAAELATEVAKDPVTNADLISDVSTLCAWIYDDTHTEYSKYSKKYVTYGVPGILRNMLKYTKLIKDLAKSGGYEYQQNELKAAEAALNKAVTKGKEIIAKIEEKL